MKLPLRPLCFVLYLLASLALTSGTLLAAQELHLKRRQVRSSGQRIFDAYIPVTPFPADWDVIVRKPGAAPQQYYLLAFRSQSNQSPFYQVYWYPQIGERMRVAIKGFPGIGDGGSVPLTYSTYTRRDSNFMPIDLVFHQPSVTLRLDPNLLDTNYYMYEYADTDVVYDGSDYTGLAVEGLEIIDLCVKRAAPGVARDITKYYVSMGFEDGSTVPLDSAVQSQYSQFLSYSLDPPIAGATLAWNVFSNPPSSLKLSTSGVAAGTDVQTTLRVLFSDGERTHEATKLIHIVSDPTAAFLHYSGELAKVEKGVAELKAGIDNLTLGYSVINVTQVPDILEDPPGFFRLREIPPNQIHALLIAEKVLGNAGQLQSLFKESFGKSAEDYIKDQVFGTPDSLNALKRYIARKGLEIFDIALNSVTFGNSPYRTPYSYNQRDYAIFKQFPFKHLLWLNKKELYDLYAKLKQDRDGAEGILLLLKQAINANGCIAPGSDFRHELNQRVATLEGTLLGTIASPGGLVVPPPNFYPGLAPTPPTTPRGVVQALPAGNPYLGKQSLFDSLIRSVDEVINNVPGAEVRMGTTIESSSTRRRATAGPPLEGTWRLHSVTPG